MLHLLISIGLGFGYSNINNKLREPIKYLYFLDHDWKLLSMIVHGLQCEIIEHEGNLLFSHVIKEL